MKALLVIDMIKRDVSKLKTGKRILGNQLKLIDAFQKKKCKVIIVGGSKSGIKRKQKNPVMQRLWGSEGVGDAEGNKVVPELLKNYDLYVQKSEYSAFYKTKLESYLRKNKITDVYLCGIFAGCCVYFTGADAAMRGIQPIIISDAVSSNTAKRTKMNIDNFKIFMGPAMTTSQVVKNI